MGAEGYCQKCCRYYSPEEINKFAAAQVFGHGLQSWVVYQRLVLRLPYRLIAQAMGDLFNEPISEGTIGNFLNNFARYYAATEDLLIEHILASPFVHVDETTINIQGADHYVWVFTDDTHVAFRMTETREATIVHDFLSNYQGILISDFYPGYDSVKCRQQKCLVHLIRDLNEDLWKSPFDSEFEAFILEVKNLLVPILAAVQKYGLKKRHLQKFSKQIDQFYERVITDRTYHSDLTIRYQSRFKRYRQSLFTFIEHDGIPWNNAFVERYHRSYKYECLLVHRPSTLQEAIEGTKRYQEHYNWQRPHQGRSCHNMPPRIAHPDLPHLPVLPAEVDPDCWVDRLHGHAYVRHVGADGCVTVDERSYYVGLDQKGKTVALLVNAPARSFEVWEGSKLIKRLPIKGLQGTLMPLERFIAWVREQAIAEERRGKRQTRAFGWRQLALWDDTSA